MKNKLSEYVRLAAGGETVLISDRDRVVAELVPPAAGRSRELPDAILAEAVRSGFISPAIGSTGRPPAGPVEYKLKDILGDLEGDRQDR